MSTRRFRAGALLDTLGVKVSTSTTTAPAPITSFAQGALMAQTAPPPPKPVPTISTLADALKTATATTVSALGPPPPPPKVDYVPLKGVVYTPPVYEGILSRIAFNADGTYASTSVNMAALNDLMAYLKANPALKVTVPASVGKWLMDHGIAPGRITYRANTVALAPLAKPSPSVISTAAPVFPANGSTAWIMTASASAPPVGTRVKITGPSPITPGKMLVMDDAGKAWGVMLTALAASPSKPLVATVPSAAPTTLASTTSALNAAYVSSAAPPFPNAGSHAWVLATGAHVKITGASPLNPSLMLVVDDAGKATSFLLAALSGKPPIAAPSPAVMDSVFNASSNPPPPPPAPPLTPTPGPDAPPAGIPGAPPPPLPGPIFNALPLGSSRVFEDTDDLDLTHPGPLADMQGPPTYETDTIAVWKAPANQTMVPGLGMPNTAAPVSPPQTAPRTPRSAAPPAAPPRPAAPAAAAPAKAKSSFYNRGLDVELRGYRRGA